MRQATRALGLLAALLCTGALAGEAPALTLLQPFEVVDTSARPLKDGVRVTLELRPEHRDVGAELSRRVGRPVDAGGRLVLEDAATYPESRDRVLPRYRSATFVIDHDMPVFEQVRAEVKKALGPKPSMAQLVGFVDGYIQKKNLSRLFDPASVVAQRREGDCTEHAVLLTALARAYGFPARVVSGVVLVPTPEGARAFGHAWVEHAEKGRWKRADAALPESLGAAYLPLTVMQEEGPGFMMAQENQGPLGIRRLLVEAGTPAKTTTAQP